MNNSSKTLGKLTIPLLVLLTICFLGLPAYAKYGGGTGEPNDPYLIFDANQMNAIGADSNDWDKHFKLMADIDLSAFTGTSFNIIGYCVGSWEDDKPFTGVFDGNGHTISNFTYTSTDRNYIGIFAYVNDFEAAIKDLGLIDPDVDAGTGDYVGSLVGWFRGGTMTDCYVDGAAVAGAEGVGGLVGQNGICYHADECHGGKMSNCYSTGSVSGYWAVGGLVGKSNGGTIYNCYSDSVVSGTTGVGGLLGDNEEGAIFNSYSHSDVSGNERVGGLLGTNHWGGTVTSSYSTASVSGTTDVGGLAGYNQGGGAFAASSFWDTQTSGQSTSVGGTPRTTAQMQDPNTFTDAGWDFVGKPDGPHDVWAEPAGGGYPILCWQLPPFFGLPGFSGGSGTTDDPYLISTADELNSIGHNPRLMAAHFKLIDDIDLTGTDLFLIGSELFPFRGVFDGNGRKISNFTYSSTDADQIGLFKYVYGENALIKDLGVIAPDVNVGKGYDVGSLVGRLFEGKVTNCYVQGGSVSGNFCVGGLIGHNNRGTLTNCNATGEVSGYFYVGGLVGQSYYGTINNCDSEADVYGGSYAGGLLGYNDWGSTINNCHTTGTVSGGGSVGGLVGYNFATISNCNTTGTVSGSGSVGGLAGSSSYGKITKCYAAGEVRGGNLVGGLVGNNSSTMTNCYADGDVSGGHNVGGLAGRHSYRTIDNCYANGDASGTGSSVGGLVGQNYSGTISNCYAEGGASGNMYVGGLAGWNQKGTITDCYSTGGASGTRSNVGGLVGSNYGDATINNCYSTGSAAGDEDVGGFAGSNGGTINNCYSTGGVSGHSDVGGMVGDNYYGTMTNCSSAGSVSGTGMRVGGLVGRNEKSTITDCYATGGVSGNMYVGGLVGRNWRDTITNCYSTGGVAGNEYVGGLVGHHWQGEVTNSFWDIETSGQTTSAGGTGLPTAEMQMGSTFTDAGWDFVGETVNGIEDIWFIPQQDYPHLWWEGMQVPMKLTPRTLNCRSYGNWVKAHLTLPEGFTVADVDPDRPAVLHSFGFQSAPLYVFVNENERVQIEAAFEREQVCSLAGHWPETLTVAGFLTDGNIFLGTSTVRMITPGLKDIEDLASCWLQGDCVHPTWCDRIDMNRDSLVNFLDYALLMNSQVEFVSE